MTIDDSFLFVGGKDEDVWYEMDVPVEFLIGGADEAYLDDTPTSLLDFLEPDDYKDPSRVVGAFEEMAAEGQNFDRSLGEIVLRAFFGVFANRDYFPNIAAAVGQGKENYPDAEPNPYASLMDYLMEVSEQDESLE